MMTRIYLDNNATTAAAPEVLDAMRPYWNGASGNASSLHFEGRLARRAIESAREQVAACLDADPRQVIFTSGGTEANNLAVRGLAGQAPARLASSTIEHPSVRGCFDLLATCGFLVDYISVNESGQIRSDCFAAAMERQPRLVSIMVANNETGAIQPISELARQACSRGALFHSDAVQAAGKIALSFRSLGVTSLSISAHKFHGPAGVGALIIDSPHRLQPLLVGGHQEFGVRAGTEPVAQIVGLAAALALASRHLDASAARLRKLTRQLVERLQTTASPFTVNSPEHRLANTVNLLFHGVDAQAAVVALDLEGLACSTGSACSSGAPTPSPTLLAMGLNEQQARSSIRFSLSSSTSEADIVRSIPLIAKVIRRLRTA
jgi:cysteine desulfurase